MIVDRRTANPIARLPPIPQTDRFELFYWSNAGAPLSSCWRRACTAEGHGPDPRPV
jgi:hypothetical protein